MIVAVDTNCIIPGQVGGIENYTLGLIEALQLPDSPARRLVLLTRAENHELFGKFANGSTEVVKLSRPRHKGRKVTNWAQLLEKHPIGGRRTLAEYQKYKSDVIEEHGVELVHFPGNTVNPLDLRLPVVLNLHDLQHRHFPQYFSREEIDNREKWWAASAYRAEALIAGSNFIRGDLHRQLRIPPGKVFVAPDVFQNEFRNPPTPEQIQETRRRLNLSQPFFLYPAAVWPHKNHARLIRAFAAAELPDVQLILTGGGQKESSLPALIEELNLSDRVRLAGRVSTDELRALYHLAMGMIFPSEHESWSIPIMEAMAAGCPVASSNVTSLPEEVEDAGLLFDPHDEAAMRAAMRRLATDADLREELSQAGLARVQQFSPETFLARLSHAYDHACEEYSLRKAA